MDKVPLVQKGAPLHDSTEFYVQCAIKFVHENEKISGGSPLKEWEGKDRDGKKRGPPAGFCPGAPEFLVPT